MARKDYHQVSLNPPKHINTIASKDMEPGEYAEIVGRGSGSEGRIIGRIWHGDTDDNFHFQHFFAVDNPRSTWTDPDFEVRVLTPGEIVTITIGSGSYTP